jgi:ATP-dependent RNA helicase DDX24/MAK5
MLLCRSSIQDSILYYVLLRYPGRTIVFVNSIDAIRRLVPILKLLKVDAYPLHAEMQQRQRLKNLDKFKSNANAVLIASDVASRGLDIPHVDHVVHYQLPRSADLYVHRAGRTARGKNQGLSIMLCSPDQLTLYKKLCHSLEKENGVPDFPIDKSVMSMIKQRLALARKIDEYDHKNRKKESEKSWFEKAAMEADVELEQEWVEPRGDKKSAEAQGWRRQLDAMLEKKVIPKGVSVNYLTSNVNRDLADSLLMNVGSKEMPAAKHHSALDDIKGR